MKKNYNLNSLPITGPGFDCNTINNKVNTKRNLVKGFLFVFIAVLLSAGLANKVNAQQTITLNNADFTATPSNNGGSYHCGNFQASPLGIFCNMGGTSGSANNCAGSSGAPGSSQSVVADIVNFMAFNISGNGASGYTPRAMQIGDSMTIQTSNLASFICGTGTGSIVPSGSVATGGVIGITWNDYLPTSASAATAITTNPRAYIQLSSLTTNWTSNPASSSGTPGTNVVLSLKVTSSSTCNITIGGTTTYDLTMLGSPGASSRIQSFAIYTNGTNQNTFWGNSNATLFATGIVDLGAGGTSATIGTIADGEVATSNVALSNAVHKSGSGTTTLGAANSYTGATSIGAGTLAMGINAALPSTTAVTLANVATANLSLATFNESIVSLAGGGSTGGNVSLGTGTLTINGNTTTTYSGAIASTAGNLVMGTGSSTGTLILAGVNSSTGTTTIKTGATIQLGVGSAITASNIILAGGTLSNGASSTFFSNTTTGTLGLSASSTIALGGTTSQSLTFANSSANIGNSAWAGGAILTITGWSGTAVTGPSSGPHIMVGTGGLNSTQLLQVQFFGYGVGAVIVSGELIPAAAAVPTITSITSNTTSTNTGYTGSVITVNGNNFGTVAANITINFSASGLSVNSLAVNGAGTVITFNLISTGTPSTAGGTISVTTTALGTGPTAAFTYLGYLSVNASSADWNTGSTWLGNGVGSIVTPPPSGATATINTTVTVNSAAETPAVVIVNSGKALSINSTGSSGSVTASTGITTAGTITAAGAASVLSGAITINTSGNVIIGIANAITSSSNITLSGGTLTTGVSTTGYSDNLGTLSATGTASTIALVGTNNYQDVFSGVGTISIGLNVTGWLTTAGFPGTHGQIFVGSSASVLNSTQLGFITFTSFASVTGLQLPTGELTPSGAIIGGAGVYDSYITIGSTQYYIGVSGALPPTLSTHSVNPSTASFQGANLGSFSQSSTISLASSIEYTWKNTSTTTPPTPAGNANANVCTGNLLNASIVGTALTGQLTMSTFGSPTSTYGQEQSQATTSGTTIALSTLAPGTYYLQVSLSLNAGPTGCSSGGILVDGYGTGLPSSGTTEAYQAQFTVTCNAPVLSGLTNLTPCSGSNATFGPVVTTPTGSYTYQWYETSTASAISGATSASYTINGATSSNNGSYFVIVTSGTCTTTSSAVTLTATTAPSLSGPAASASACVGTAASAFTVTPTPSGSYTYQWYKGTTATSVSGATSASYTDNNVASGDGGTYFVVVTSGTCSTTSSGEVFTANPVPALSGLTSTVNSCTGNNASLGTVVTTPSGSYTYQWYETSTANAISGATSANYTINSATSSNNGSYFVIVTQGTCTTTSSAVALTVTTPPSLSGPAASTSACVGTAASAFTVTPTPSGSYTYQWYIGTTATSVSGATSASYTDNNVASGDGGTYFVVVTSGTCSTTSSGEVFTANPVPALSGLTSTVSVCTGNNASLGTVVTTPSGSYTYQWYETSTANSISGATSANYTINSATPSNNGSYFVIVTQGTCTTTSSAVALTISSGGWLGGDPLTPNEWNDANNWCGGGVPTASTAVSIPVGPYYPVIDNANANCAGITIASGASLTMSGGNTLTIASGGSYSGSSTSLVPGNGAIIFAGTGSITGAANFYNLSLQSGAVALSASSAISVTNLLTLGSGSTSGTLTLAGNSISVAGLATSGSGASNTIQDANGTAATLTIKGSVTSSFGGILANGSSGSLALVVSGPSSNLTLTGANTFTGGVTLNPGGTLVLGATNTINSISNSLTFAGGTLQTGTGTTGYSNNFGNIFTSAGTSSIINLIATLDNPNQQLKFNGIGSLSSTAFININNWEGTVGASTAGTGGQVFVGSGSSLGSNTDLFLVNGDAAAQLSTAEVVPILPLDGAYDSYLWIGTATPTGYNTPNPNYYLGTSGYIPCTGTMIPNSLNETTFNGATLTGSPFYQNGTLNFSGAAFYGWKNGSGNICTGTTTTWYRIYSATGTPGTFISLSTSASEGSLSPLPVCASNTLNPYYNNTNTLNILNSLTPGTYTLEVYLQSYTGACSSNPPFYVNGLPMGVSGNNYKANFVVVCPNAPVITTQPASQTPCAGNSGTFSVIATVGTGTGPLTYQWYSGTNTINGVAISGATSSSYSTSTLGNYYVSVANSNCAIPSSIVTITNPPAGTWIGGNTGDPTEWNEANNWCGGIPTATTAATIPAGLPHYPVIDNATPAAATCASITLASGATLTMSGSNTLTIANGGSFTNNNSSSALVPANGTVIFAGTGSIGGSATTAFYNLSVQSGAVTLSKVISVSNILTLGNSTGNTPGSLVLNGNSISVAALATSGTGASTINDGTSSATLTVTGALTSSFNGGITNGTSGTTALAVSGTSNLTLTGTNSFTGGITINTGATLVLGATNTINSSSNNVVLAGGTLSSGATTGFSNTLGTLTLSASSGGGLPSTISLGTGSHTLAFANSSAVTWTVSCSGSSTNVATVLSINGWQTTAGVTGTAGHLTFGSGTSGLTASQLTQINFTGFAIGSMLISTGGNGELVPLNTNANFGVYDSYVSVGGTQYYLGNTGSLPAGYVTNAASSPALTVGLGTLYAGSTATITPASLNIWKSNGTIQGNMSGAIGYYRIWSTSSTAGSFISDLNCFGFISQGTVANNLIPQVWNSACSSSIPTPFSALPQGTYNLQFYIAVQAQDNTSVSCYQPVNVGFGNTTTFSIGPSITSVVPTPVIGTQANNTGYTGQTLTITGSGFTGVTAVTIGGVAATSFNVASNTSITAVVGPAAGGTTVAITGSAGTTSTAAFTYLGYLSQSNGNWSSAGSWLGTTYVPAAGYPVTIASNITLDGAASATPSSLTINSGFTFTASDASPETLTISATASGTTLANNGTWANGAGGSTVVFTAPLSATGTIIHTISGTLSMFNVSVGRTSGSTAVAGVDFNTGAHVTITNNYTINNGGFTNVDPPVYGTNSTLIYNTGNTYTVTSTTAEWVGTATTGAGVPRNVQVGTSAVSNTVLSFGAVSAVYQVQGNLTVGQPTGSGYGMTLSSNQGFTLEIGGNYTIQSGASVTNLDRGIEFDGSTAIQQIQYTGGGMVYFDYLILDNPNWNLQLYPGTNVTMSYASQPTATILQMLNNMQLDLNGQTFTMNGNSGAEIQVNFTGRTIMSSISGGIFAIYTSTTVVNISNVGTLNIGVSGANQLNTTLQINSAFNCGGSLTYIYGVLQMQNNGFITGNSPTYQSGSLLDYNSGNVFGRALEWNASSNAGYPCNVEINTGTLLDAADDASGNVNIPLTLSGSFTLYGTFNMNQTFSMTSTLNAVGNINIYGTLTASTAIGGDIALEGNWLNNGTFNAEQCLTTFYGTQASQTVGGTSPTTFAQVNVNKSSGTVSLNNYVTINGTLNFLAGTITLNSSNLYMGTSASITGTLSASNDVIATSSSGQFVWNLPVISSSSSRLFPIGDGTNYTPVTLAFASNTVAGTLGVNVVNAVAPNIGSANAYLNRYWNFGNNTLTGNYSYTGTFKYVEPGDVTGTESKIQLSAYSGSVWQAYYGSTASTGSLTLSETLNQTTAPLAGVFTGREGTPAAYAVTGGNNCYSTTVGVANSQADVSYQLYANGSPTGSPIVPSSTGNAISFGAQTIATATTYTVVATDGNGNTTAMTGSASVYVTPVPTANNTGPVCPYNLVSITSGPNGFTAYSWSGPNSYSSTSQNPAAFVSGGNEGIYTVTVTNGNNCTASKTTTITSLPLPVVSVTPTEAICTGQTTVPLSVSATSGGGGPYSYTWAPNTALNTTTGSSVTASISLLTFYTVTGVGSNGCTANSNIVPVATVPFGGTVTPTATVICSGGITTLTSTGAAGHDYQWQISPDNVNWTNIGGATGSTYTTIGETTKQYYRQLANSNACYDIASTTGIVDISVTPTVTITSVTSTTATVTWTPYGSGQYNISWSGNAGSGSASALTSNSFVVGQSPTTALIPNEDLLVTITPATIPACGGVNAASMGTHTLCGSPTVTNVSATASHGFVVDWDAVTGATAYRVYYRDLSNSTSWSFVDVTGGATSVTITANAATYAVYVAAKDCPATGNIGDASTPVNYVTTNPVPSCGPPPTVSTVSNCPNQITVSISGSGPPYNLILRRISPSLTAGVSYPISTSAVNVTIGTQYAGSTWEIFATQVCGPGSISAASNISDVTVKPACPVVNNLVLSHPTCNGFTASWNTSDCAGLGISKYELLIKRSNELNYAGYPVSSQLNYETVTWEPDNTTYDVVVMAVACNDASSGYSNEQTISSLNCGREGVAEDANSNATGNTKESVTVYPNPAQGQFYLDIGRTDMSEAGIKIELLNELGQVVETNISQISGGHLSQLISTPEGLATGIYFVRTSVGGNVYVNKLMISRE